LIRGPVAKAGATKRRRGGGCWIKREEGVGKGRRNARPAGQRGAWEWEPKARSWIDARRREDARRRREGESERRRAFAISRRRRGKRPTDFAWWQSSFSWVERSSWLGAST
jgi:hypothetical protein